MALCNLLFLHFPYCFSNFYFFYFEFQFLIQQSNSIIRNLRILLMLTRFRIHGLRNFRNPLILVSPQLSDSPHCSCWQEIPDLSVPKLSDLIFYNCFLYCYLLLVCQIRNFRICHFVLICSNSYLLGASETFGTTNSSAQKTIWYRFLIYQIRNFQTWFLFLFFLFTGFRRYVFTARPETRLSWTLAARPTKDCWVGVTDYRLSLPPGFPITIPAPADFDHRKLR